MRIDNRSRCHSRAGALNLGAVVDLIDLFGEANLKTLALATSEDAKAHLAAGRPLRAAFSAAHYVHLTRRRTWTEDEHQSMGEALFDDVVSRLRAGDDTTAAWRAAYLRMLTGAMPWSDSDLGRLIRAATPKPGLRPWSRIWFAGQAADYYLLSGETFWDAPQLQLMLTSAREDFAVRLRGGDKLMAADRVVLYMVLASSADQAKK
ncbi:MAG TPA: hypothetical protein VH951_05180 [Dehalococcoidia bacterium]